nr:MAG TPA: hypothetical protein [Caudoviricetes sp.]
MIDDKKIEKAARQISEKVVDAKGFDDSKPTHLAFSEGHVAGFKEGAKWAINELLKNLWHDVFKERIPYNKMVIVEYTSKGGIYYQSLKIPDDIQWVRGFSNVKRLRRWLYVDDLLPKEESCQKF